MNRPLSRLALSLVALLMLSGGAFAQTAIKYVVNGLPITSYDISQRTKLLALTGGKGGTAKAMEELIDEAVQLSEAKRRGITIAEAQVDKAFASLASNLKMSPAQLTAALGQQGVSAVTLKNRIRAQMAWGQLAQGAIARAKNKKPAEDSGKFATVTIQEYLLRPIIVVFPKDASAGTIAERRRTADSVRARFSGCDNALDVAKVFRDVAVQEVIRRDSNQLRGPIGDEIAKLPIGKTTKPNQTPQGFEMIAVCARKEIQTTGPAGASSAAPGKPDKETEEVVKTYLKELRDKATIEKR